PTVSPSGASGGLRRQGGGRGYPGRGPPFGERSLPFWMAVTVERWSLLLLPIVGILLPLMRFLPMIYNAQMRKRVTRWYRVVHEIDHRLAHCTPEDAAAAAGPLRALPEENGEMTPPSPALLGELEVLKQHLEWLLSHAEEKATEAKVAAHSPR